MIFNEQPQATTEWAFNWSHTVGSNTPVLGSGGSLAQARNALDKTSSYVAAYGFKLLTDRLTMSRDDMI